MNAVKIKFKDSIDRNWWLYAFILGAFLYYMYMSISGIAFGKNIFVEGDVLDSYLPISTDLARNILSGDDIFYSWNYGMGKNNVAVVASYGQICGISNILFLIFNGVNPAIPAFIALLIKAGLTAMCFQIYSVRYLNSNKFLCLIMSMCYSMCSFQVYFNVINYFFMDALWILPLIIYFIRRFLDDDNWIPLTLCYAYIFINSLYMAYMIGIFSFIFFMCFLFKDKHEGKYIFRKIFKYCLSVLLALGLFAFLLIPSVYYILNHNVEDAYIAQNNKITLFDVYNQLFIGENNTKFSFFPYIYSGIVSLLLFPLYFFNKKIEKKKRFINLGLLLILVISCLVYYLNLFWHVFNSPDDWGYRYAYIISFILCSVVCEELKFIKEIKIKTLIISAGINSIIYIALLFYQKKYLVKFQANNIQYFVINFIFMFLCVLLIFAYQKLSENIKYNKLIYISIVMCVSFELLINGYASWYQGDFSKPAVKTDVYYQWVNCTKDSVKEIKNIENSNDFYRVDVQGDFSECSDTFFGYNGNSDFDSIENYSLRKALRKLGIYTSAKLMMPFGYTDFTNMLMGIKYGIVHYSYNDFSPYMNPKNEINELDSYIGLGYLVDDSVKEISLNDDNPYNNLNELSKKMSGMDLDLYEVIDDEYISYKEDGIEFIDIDNKKYITKTTPYGEDGTLSISVPNSDKKAYVTFSYGDCSAYMVNVPYLEGGRENIRETYGRITSKYIKPMDIKEDTYSVNVCMFDDEEIKKIEYPSVYASYYNKDNFEKVYDNLKQNPMKVLDYHNGYVHAKVTASEDRKLLFTSIPYEEGWKVYVNGKEKDIVKLIDDAFIGVELDEGENELIFDFTVPYAKTGRNITIVSVIILGLALFTYKKKYIHKQSENNSVKIEE